MKTWFFLLFSASVALFAKTEIVFWHAFEGFLYDQFAEIIAVRDFYSTADNLMYSLPWNASTGILFYNKKAFKQAGLDPEKPPKTWEDLETAGIKLVNAGYKAFVTAWPVAYHLEHLCSWHNLPFATEQNGFGGLKARLHFNGPYQLRHISKLVEWQRSGIFSYQGRFVNQPEQLHSCSRKDSRLSREGLCWPAHSQRGFG